MREIAFYVFIVLSLFRFSTKIFTYVYNNEKYSKILLGTIKIQKQLVRNSCHNLREVWSKFLWCYFIDTSFKAGIRCCLCSAWIHVHGEAHCSRGKIMFTPCFMNRSGYICIFCDLLCSFISLSLQYTIIVLVQFLLFNVPERAIFSRYARMNAILNPISLNPIF